MAQLLRRRSLPAAPPATPPEEIEYAPTRRTPPWIEALGIVNFDLLVGQAVEFLCPPLPFSAEQETEIAFLCFPDANHVADGDNCHDFIFAFNKSEFDASRCLVQRSHEKPHAPSSHRRSFGADSDEYFCSTLFRQKKDTTIARGAQQKALFVMSRYPLPGFFRTVLHRLCSTLFDGAACDPAAVLQQACDEIFAWPAILPNLQYTSLPFLGTSLICTTPAYVAADIRSKWTNAGAKLRFSIHALSPVEELLTQLLSETIDDADVAKIFERGDLDPDEAETLRAAGKELGWDGKQLSDSLTGECAVRVATSLIGRAFAESPTRERNPHQTAGALSVARLVGKCDRRFADALGALNAELAALQSECFEVLAYKAPESTRRIAAAQRTHFFREVEIHSALFPHITKLSKLWELMIIGAPVAIVGPDAPHVSACVLALPSLIAPLHFVGIVRPYLTINNREIDTCVVRESSPATIAGATNPFFVKHFERWPHFICIANLEGDVQTHKMFPDNSEKRAKQQFKLKNRMFCSRHYLVKTDKVFGDELTRTPPTPTFVQESCSKATSSISHHFRGITEEFIAPIKGLITQALFDGAWFFASDDELAARFTPMAILEALQSSTIIPTHRFKSSKEAMSVYEAFVRTPTFQHYLASEIQTAYRTFILCADSLECVVAPARTPERMRRVLNNLQWTFKHELRKHIVDVALVQKLSALCALIPAVREEMLAE